MLMVAERNPRPLGLNVTTKVVELLMATDAAGAVVTVKSEAFAPLKVIAPILSAVVAVLRFWIVNVLVMVPDVMSVVPKLVESVTDGVESPSTMVTAFP